MTEEEYLILSEKINTDLLITESNVLLKSIEIPQIYTFYLNHYRKTLKYYKELLVLKDKIYGELFHYYKYEFTHALDKKTDIEPYINSNEKFYKILIKVNNQEIYLKWLEKALDNIKQMSFNIKNFIDYKKFMNGV